MQNKAKKTIQNELGLLLVYGYRLPHAGVVFLAPVKRGMLRRVREAMSICADRWPNPNRRKKYEDIWADGSLSCCDEDKDRTAALRIKAWEGNRYYWDFNKETFVPLEPDTK